MGIRFAWEVGIDDNEKPSRRTVRTRRIRVRDSYRMKQHNSPLGDVFQLLKTYPLRWLLPTVAIAIAAFFYARSRPAMWEASQALIVRDEAAGTDHLGKFHIVDDMKTVQETILELAKGRSVLSSALESVGPPMGRPNATPWPSDLDIAALQGAMKLSPPKGAEFGKTEVFYLQVQNADRDRACSPGRGDQRSTQEAVRATSAIAARRASSRRSRGLSL